MPDDTVGAQLGWKRVIPHPNSDVEPALGGGPAGGWGCVVVGDLGDPGILIGPLGVCNGGGRPDR